jgi:predicted Rossmann fold nucleotide-binding protein DprA/Smf involved in DNA uptake
MAAIGDSVGPGGEVMGADVAAASVYPAPTEQGRAAYFDAQEESLQKVALLILRRLREEERNTDQQPRRTLVEVAVETGMPIQVVQQVVWTLETRGDIRWDQGRFVVLDETA